MAENPQRMSKSMMNSPYFSGISQGKQGAQRVNRPNMSTVNQGRMPARAGQAPQQGQIYGRPVYSDRGSAKSYAKYQKFNNKEYDAYSKQKRKERDFFYVMRRGSCFFIFLFATIMLAVMVLGFFNVMPNYSAFFIEPDSTPIEDRPEGYEVQDKYISVSDPIYGFIGKVTGKPATEYTYQSNVDALKMQADANPVIGSTIKIFAMIYEYYPIAVLILAIFIIAVFFMSFIAMFNKRIIKGFCWLAFVMGIMAVITNVAGILVMFSKLGLFSPDLTSILSIDYSTIIPYLDGYGLYLLTVMPLLIWVFGLFAKRRVPYSVFDR